MSGISLDGELRNGLRHRIDEARRLAAISSDTGAGESTPAPAAVGTKESFGEAVERLMHAVGQTYRSLATRTGLSAGYLNHLVHGREPVPSNAVIERLADALDVEPAHFHDYRLRVVVERLAMAPDLMDELYVWARRGGSGHWSPVSA